MSTTQKPLKGRSAGEALVFPPEDLDQLLDLSHFLQDVTEPGLLLGPDGEKIPLPMEIYEVLRQVVEVMRQGKATMVAPQGMLLTSQEAADFLSISRPTMVKMLEGGVIPFERPNRHRRVRLEDVLAFQKRRRMERRETLNAFTRDAGHLGVYGDSLDDYASVLKESRKREGTRPARK